MALGVLAVGALAEWTDPVYAGAALGIAVVAVLVMLGWAFYVRGRITALVADTSPDADRWSYVEKPWPVLRELIVVELARQQIGDGLDVLMARREAPTR